METIAEPKLAPPGAGLPTPELYIARMLFAWRRARGNRDSFNARFQKERELVRRLKDGCDEESAAQRVLIERPRGLEDSSRYWSVWMTLDHLRIVNSNIARIMGALKGGVVPQGHASTANVKPSTDVTGAVVAEYEKACDDVIAASLVGELKTKARFAHHWFGPLNAAGWHALAAGHMAIHRVQLERIVDGLRQQTR